MADAIFADRRLAAIYDFLDAPERLDLDPYLAMAEEFGVQSVIDVGCGTGNLACRLAASSCEVVGIDPAAASLDVARRKPYADRVRWINGTAAALASIPSLSADLVTMTGNVAQVFVTDEEWSVALGACRGVIRPAGRLVFETRDPSKEAWKAWNRERSYEQIDIPGIGQVEKWVELVDVDLPLVSFRYTFVFHADGAVITSDSTLRFRSRSEVIDSLLAAGLSVESTRDAPDRSGLEFVFVARLSA
ncbi:MAG TPA: class I SAM-dependent methyltransferase [Ktedonobacterales bacterium]